MTQLVAEFEKRFRDGTVIRADLAHPVDAFSVLVLFGPSGCGKTTILRCLAGLDQPESGSIRFLEETWFDATRRTSWRPQQRQVGYLSQDYALFPHLTVLRNISYGLQSLPAIERERRAREMLSLFDLDACAGRYPHQVSGGQQQRIALARALACRPRLLLLDEPLSALDSTLRERLRGELRSWLKKLGIATILVTHDRTEAISLATRIAVIDEGRVLQTGTPEEVFSRPANLEVSAIVGVETVHPATIVNRANGLVRVRIGRIELSAIEPPGTSNECYVCLRAEEVTLQKDDVGTTSARNRLAGTVTSLVSEGPLVRVTLDCGFSLVALVTRPACNELDLKEGDTVFALVKAPAIHLLPK